MPINDAVIDNPKSERVRRVADLGNRKGRERSGRFLIEGVQAVREAVFCRPDAIHDLYVQTAGAELAPLIRQARGPADAAGLHEGGARDDDRMHGIIERARQSRIHVHPASTEVMRRMSPDAQGIAAVGNIEAMRVDAAGLDLPERSSIAAFWQVRDPGNAGTVIRAADAAGCDAVVLVDDCVDALNPKVIRATAGSLFHIPVVSMQTDEFFAWSRVRAIVVIAADIYGTATLKPQPLPRFLADRGPVDGVRAVLFGNEARGLPEEILCRVQRIVSIPMYGKAESLNLAASAAVILMGMAMSSHIGRM